LVIKTQRKKRGGKVRRKKRYTGRMKPRELAWVQSPYFTF